MGIVQTIIRVTGGVAVALVKYTNDCNLYRLSLASGEVKVLRGGTFITVPQQALVPGDVIVVSPGVAPCDMILISADHVIVDESALTGEATPVAKTEIDPTEGKDKVYDPKIHKRYTIFAGTNILESNGDDKDLAVVTHTGTFTAKGELLRDILFYERHRFKFDVEVELVVAILLCYALVASAITLVILGESEWVYGWFYAIYVLAAALPPLLPTVFVVSVGVSSQRLILKQIAVADSGGILVAGKVRKAFFDKTGTLTKQGLEFSSMEGAADGKWLYSTSPTLKLAMAVCHTLSKSKNGVLLGNAVDSIMFQATSATFEQVEGKQMKVTDTGGQQVIVIKRFDFDYHRMTQSVLVKTADGKLLAIVKGSIDSLSRLCSSDSLPADWSARATKAARGGIYQISIGVRNCGDATAEVEEKFATMDRDDFENDLSFVGFVNFKNTLKEDSAEVLKTLEEGDVHCYMVTGDSVLTGICIAKECGMIEAEGQVILGDSLDNEGNITWVDWSNDEVLKLPSLTELLTSGNGASLAIKGKVWASLSDDKKKELAPFIRVYGRCTPHNKVSVVATFVDLGFVTLMCGDGGNDCGALKTAHVGVALSDAEASVVAPFTSLNKSISSVVDVLKEGRCALASSFAAYK
jgi:predicted P-type ATPase